MNRRNVRSGFTLIEVLLGVIILGLGLLGLAAVFPAVVVQQRQASDTVEGESIARSAESFLTASTSLVFQDRGWDILRRVSTGSTWWSDDGAWQIPAADDADPMFSYVTLNDPLRPFTIRVGEDGVAGTAYISLYERMSPSPRLPAQGANAEQLSAADEPRFVWDIAARRVRRELGDLDANAPADAGLKDSVMVAVFVRRIDSGIRRDGQTLHTRFAEADWVPVAEDSNGRPTFDGGRGQVGSGYQYSRIRDNIELTSFGGDALLSERGYENEFVVGTGVPNAGFFAQGGQQFVSPLGNIYRVVQVESRVDGAGASATVLTVEPSMPRSEFIDPDGAFSATVRVLGTPQVPVGVRVFTVPAPNRQ
jgi:prepilin-type N-terminal cleavage/methylation domain-containing protein